MDPVSLICPVIDARNARVYASLYRDGKEMMKPCALSCDVLCEKLKSEYSGEKILFTGDGIFANRTRFTELLGEMYRPVSVELSGGNPAAISLLARAKYASAEAAGTLSEFTAESLKVEYYKNYTDSI